jgi:phage shock protein PspC (stress-responsive transcriptional regulator)
MTSQTPPQAPGPQAVPPGGPGVAHFFDRIRAFGAVRPDEGRWAAGVAAGLARRWGVDPLLVRGGFVVLALFGGIGLLLYGLGWLFLPHPDGRIHAQEVLGGTVTAGFVGGLLAVLADLGGSGWRHDDWYGPRPFGGGLVVVALIALAVWWFASGRHRHGPAGPGGPGGSGGSGGPGWGGPAGPAGPAGPGGAWTPTAPSSAPTDPAPGEGRDGADSSGDRPDGTSGTGPSGPASGPSLSASGALPAYGTPPAPSATLVAPAPVVVPTPPRPDLTRPSHALTRVVLGGALLSAGTVLVADRVWGLDHPAGVAAATALAIVAVGVLVAGVLGRRAGGLAPVGILLAVVALGSAANTGPVTWVGERTWTPGVVTADTDYTLGVGDARLDLTNVQAPGASASDPVEIDVRVGAGALTVVVPRGVGVRVVADAGNGEVRNLGGLRATPAGATPPASVDDQRPDLDVTSAPNPQVLVRADLGVGRITLLTS